MACSSSVDVAIVKDEVLDEFEVDYLDLIPLRRRMSMLVAGRLSGSSNPRSSCIRLDGPCKRVLMTCTNEFAKEEAGREDAGFLQDKSMCQSDASLGETAHAKTRTNSDVAEERKEESNSEDARSLQEQSYADRIYEGNAEEVPISVSRVQYGVATTCLPENRNSDDSDSCKDGSLHGSGTKDNLCSHWILALEAPTAGSDNVDHIFKDGTQARAQGIHQNIDEKNQYFESRRRKDLFVNNISMSEKEYADFAHSVESTSHLCHGHVSQNEANDYQENHYRGTDATQKSTICEKVGKQYSTSDETLQEKQCRLACQLVEFSSMGFLTPKEYNYGWPVEDWLLGCGEPEGQDILRAYPELFTQIPQHPRFSFETLSSSVRMGLSKFLWNEFIMLFHRVLNVSIDTPLAEKEEVKKIIKDMEAQGFQVDHLSSYMGEIDQLAFEKTKSKEVRDLESLKQPKMTWEKHMFEKSTVQDEIRRLKDLEKELENRLCAVRSELDAKVSFLAEKEKDESMLRPVRRQQMFIGNSGIKLESLPFEEASLEGSASPMKDVHLHSDEACDDSVHDTNAAELPRTSNSAFPNGSTVVSMITVTQDPLETRTCQDNVHVDGNLNETPQNEPLCSYQSFLPEDGAPVQGLNQVVTASNDEVPSHPIQVKIESLEDCLTDLHNEARNSKETHHNEVKCSYQTSLPEDEGPVVGQSQVYATVDNKVSSCPIQVKVESPENSLTDLHILVGTSKRTQEDELMYSYQPSFSEDEVPIQGQSQADSTNTTNLSNFPNQVKFESFQNCLVNLQNISTKIEKGTAGEFSEDDVDHIPLQERIKMLANSRVIQHPVCGPIVSVNVKGGDSKRGQKRKKSLMDPAEMTPQPCNQECDPTSPLNVKGTGFNLQRKRKKTVTDSVELALEEDAPGLLEVLISRGIMVDEIKLYGDVEDVDPIEESSNGDSFVELENVISKLFSHPSNLMKFAPIRVTKGSKPSYCLACLVCLVEQTRYLQFRKWPVEWGWCRDIQSFIFVFERHNRIVLERPEYGYATYFFELVGTFPIDWQIKRLVTAMKLPSCSRITLIENKSLLIGEDLTEGEARVLEEYGWRPNTGLGSMLNYCDRVVHDRKTVDESSDWRSKIGKLLMNGYDGGTIVMADLPKKVIEYTGNRSPPLKLEYTSNQSPQVKLEH